MSQQHTGATTARRAVATRRTSLAAISGATLATLLQWSPVAEAKKSKNTAKRKARKQCQKQGASCQDFATRLCTLHHAPGPLRQSCENRANACCAAIEQCDGEEYFACLFEHLEDLEPV